MSALRACGLVVLILAAGCADGGGANHADLSLPPSDLSGGVHTTGVSTPTEHLATPPACAPRPAGSCPMSGSACATDADCTQGQGGRCQTTGIAGCACTYDQCNGNADCAAGQDCACRIVLRGVPAGGGPNSCVPANCQSDADCASGYCSPSYSDTPCGSYVVGYYCHTAADECGVSADCVADGIGYALCAYSAAAGHWRCALGAFCSG